MPTVYKTYRNVISVFIIHAGLEFYALAKSSVDTYLADFDTTP